MRPLTILAGFLGFVLAGGLCAAADRPDLAGLQPGDLARVGIKGEWSAGAPDFSGLMGSDPASGAYVYSSLFAWRDHGASTIDAAAHHLDDAAAAAGELTRLLDYDRTQFGAVTGPAAIGDGGRLMHKGASAGEAPSNTIRWRNGAYVLRLTSTGPHPLPHRVLATLAGSLSPERLAGAVAPSTPLMALLPAGEAALPELGSAAGSADWWVWTKDKAGKDVPSRTLRRLLKAGVVDDLAVLRSYAVPALPGHYAVVTVAPFTDPAAAARYMRASVEPGTTFAATDYTLHSPDPAHGFVPWRADVLVGRYAVEVDCLAEKGATQPGCEAVARGLVERSVAALQSAP